MSHPLTSFYQMFNPYPNFREGQVEIIDEIVSAYRKGLSGVVLEAGTGTGKSVIGTVAARVINHIKFSKMVANGGDKQDYAFSPSVVTKTLNLQRQYDHEFGATDVEIGVLWGKSHYSDLDLDGSESENLELNMCNKSCPGMSYKHTRDDCPYDIAKQQYKRPTSVGIINYALYLVAPAFSANVNVAVLDEAHLLPEILCEQGASSICSKRLLVNLKRTFDDDFDESYLQQCVEYESTLRKALIPIRKIVNHFQNQEEYLVAEVIPRLVKRQADLRISMGLDAPEDEVNSQSHRDKPFNIDITKSSMRKLKAMDRMIDSLKGLVTTLAQTVQYHETKSSDTPICWVEAYEPKVGKGQKVEKGINLINIKPVNPQSDMVKNLVDNKFCILMTATLEYEDFISSMSLERTQYPHIDAPTKFPVRNRTLVYNPISSVNYKNREEVLGFGGSISSRIVKVASENRNHTGLIHTISYANAEMLADVLKDSGFTKVLIPRKDQMSDPNWASKCEKGTIILSPALSEGVDLKNDLCRWQILLKVPYLPLGDPYVLTKKNRNAGWYTYQACLEIMQMVGRGTRSMDDWCVNFIFDSNFGRVQSNFPQWFKDAITDVAPNVDRGE